MEYWFLVGHAIHTRGELAPKLAGMFRLTQAHGHNAQSGRFDLFLVQLQLS